MSRKWKIVGVWVAAIVICDQITKAIVDRTMSLHDSIPIIDGFFNLTYVRNTGAAFGIFSGSHEAFRLPFLILVSVIAIGFVLVMLKRLRYEATGIAAALAFILGVMPLVLASGAGMEARHSVGTAVTGGMLFATFLNVIFIPILYVLVRTLIPGTRKEAQAHA